MGKPQFQITVNVAGLLADKDAHIHSHLETSWIESTVMHGAMSCRIICDSFEHEVSEEVEKFFYGLNVVTFNLA